MKLFITRVFLRALFVLFAACVVCASSLWADEHNFTPVTTPNGKTLPYRMDGEVKVFELTVGVCKHEIAPGMIINAWCYNDMTPGPTIEAVEGDRVRILVTNKLPEITSVHWHGILLPSGMDGVTGSLFVTRIRTRSPSTASIVGPGVISL